MQTLTVKIAAGGTTYNANSWCLRMLKKQSFKTYSLRNSVLLSERVGANIFRKI
jgi:hypothetical protein